MGQDRAVINLHVNIPVVELASGHGGATAVLARTPPRVLPISIACICQALRLYILPTAKEYLGVNTEQWSCELVIYVKPRDACGAPKVGCGGKRRISYTSHGNCSASKKLDRLYGTSDMFPEMLAMSQRQMKDRDIFVGRPCALPRRLCLHLA
jgi:hypothetical protein